MKLSALLGILVAVLVLVQSASAFDMRVMQTDVSITSCTQGSTFVYIDAQGATALSAQSNDLTVWFDQNYFTNVQGTTGTMLRVSAPQCFKGISTITIIAENQGQRVERTLRVHVTPCTACGSYQNGLPSNNYYQQHQGTLTYSSADFPLTVYDLDIIEPSHCVQVKPNEYARIRFPVINTGAAGTFDFSATSSASLNPLAQKRKGLQRGEGFDEFVDIYPSQDAVGEQSLELTATHNGQVVARASACVRVLNTHRVTVSLPPRIDAYQCKPFSLTAFVQNDGSGVEDLQVYASDFATPDSAVSIAPGESAEVNIHVDPSRLSGSRTLAVTASNDRVSATARSTINVLPCAQPQASVSIQEDGDTLRVIARVVNPSAASIPDAQIHIEGLPKSWTITSNTPVTVPAQGEATLVAVVNRATDEPATLIVTVEGAGGSISVPTTQQKVSAKPGALSGFFSVAFSNVQWIILFVLGCVVIAFLFARRGTIVQPTQKA